VSRGYIGTQVFSTYGATKEPGEPNHCGIAGGASEWFVFVTTTNGVFSLNTEGSTFDTVLAVYTGPGTSFETLVAVACDNNSGADGRTSKVMIPAEANTSYFVAVDGVAGVTGTVVLNYLLGTPPVILTNPVSRAVPLGGTAVLSVSVSASPKAVVQWKRNGAVIPGATNRSLTLSNFHLELAGTYHLSATNVLGAVLSAPAELRPDSPPRLSQSRPSANGNITVTVAGTAGQTYVIEASTNLMLWLPIGTNTPPSGIWEYAEVISTDLPCRYFRARPLP